MTGVAVTRVAVTGVVMAGVAMAGVPLHCNMSAVRRSSSSPQSISCEPLFCGFGIKWSHVMADSFVNSLVLYIVNSPVLYIVNGVTLQQSLFFPVNSLVVCHPQVGNQVDVRQLDGQYKLATILKLTDQSTYTVGECGGEGKGWED